MRRSNSSNTKNQQTSNASGSNTKNEGTEEATAGNNNPYESNIKSIATVATVDEFWNIYDHLKRPNELPSSTDLHFFREGIKPTWEDPHNEKGGKLIVRLPKGLASRYWEEVLLALIGAQIPHIPSDEICGAVLSIRYNEDILGIWNKTGTANREIVDQLRTSVKKILQLPHYVTMEYKPHQAALQDRSSFRNTQSWKSNNNNSARSNNNSTADGSNQRSTARRNGSWGEQRDTKPRVGRGDAGRAWR